MSSRTLSRIARSLTFVALSSLAGITLAQDNPFKDWSFSGLYDTYYQYNGNKPASGLGTPNNGHRFDVFNNQFSLASVQLNISKKATDKEPFAFTLSLWTGKNTDIVSANSDKYLQQAYVSYTTKTGVTLDFGKFLTWVGYEGVGSADNDNYSRSFLFTDGQPLYHEGIRATKQATKAVSVSAYLVNGWNETDDSNASKSYGATAAVTVTPKLSATVNYYGGNEGGAFGSGFGSATTTNLNLVDAILTYNATDKLKFAANADYASAKGVDAGDAGGHFSGVAVYVKDQISTKYAAALRGETFSDPDGIRLVGGRLYSVTGNLDCAETANAIFRLELRWDKSNQNQFASDKGMKDTQFLVTFSHVLKF